MYKNPFFITARGTVHDNLLINYLNLTMFQFIRSTYNFETLNSLLKTIRITSSLHISKL